VKQYHDSWLLGEQFSLHQSEDSKSILAPSSKEERIYVLQGEIKMLEELLEEVPESKCTVVSGSMLMIGCLHSISVYKLAHARLLQVDVSDKVNAMIAKLEKDDPQRAGRYKEWRMTVKKDTT